MTLETINVATIAAILLTVVGAIIAIVHPETLTYQQLIDDTAPMWGGLAVGRGIASGLKNRRT